VTDTTITIGNLADLTGPVPGLFQGALIGTQAYFSYINSQGGVDGRKLAVKSGDTGTTCQQTTTAAQGMASGVLGFVGGFVQFDNCEVPVFQAVPDLFSVQYPLTKEFYGVANEFSSQYKVPGWMQGYDKYVAQKYPDVVNAVGGLSQTTLAAQQGWKEQKATLQSVGYKIVAEDSFPVTQTDFTADVIKMRNAGVKMVYANQANGTTVARFLNAAQQQNWKPEVVLSTTAYDPNFLKTINPGAAAPLLTPEYIALYIGEDRSTVPEVDTFLTWVTKTKPGFSPDLFTLYGWTSAKLFVDAVKAAGGDLSRQGVITALKNIHNFDDNGMLSPTDVGAKGPFTCWLLAKVDGNHFARVYPDKGFSCNPGGFYYYNP
jgi:ABC-type branched-subunit amino acid transport system substrate-binding protein